ncbi:MAG: aminotransferase class I/II-fold pyridoxal phosphate-dependent enzyme [Planctomycetes bacterium]|nr:aminotransferase class I/II-fold pyridoxal phosphate-dependent enzyme [Planctomycetota bacterium]
MGLLDKCRQFTRAREIMAAGVYPYFHPIEHNDASEVVIEGRRLVMVGSNNYLGLTQHPRVKEAAVRAVEKYGSGCTGSRFLNGTLDLHVELEDRLSRFMEREAAVTFSTGFQVNLGVISTLVGKDDVVFCDRENHASIFDGCRLAFGKLRKYRHNDMQDLERQLASVPRDQGKLIVTDGVFSMRGDVCDLPSIVDLAREFDASVMVDDAHGIGVLGEHGRGTAEHFGLEDRVDLVMGTFSKSLASLGGFIAGREDVIHYIKHHARALIFSAAITPASAASALAALTILEEEPDRRRRLWRNAEKMKRGLSALGYDTDDSRSVIVPVQVGEVMDTFGFWKLLFDEGVFTNPVIPPAVPEGECLIRTSYMATHTDRELDMVLEVFGRLRPALEAIEAKDAEAGASRK